MNQKLLLFGVIILALVGGSYVLGTKKSEPIQTNSLSISPTAVTSNERSDPTANWKTYTNSQFAFTLKYPNDWFSNSCGGNEVLLLDPQDKILSCATEPLTSIVVTVDTAKTGEEYKNKLENVGFQVTNEIMLSSGIFYSLKKLDPTPGPDKFSVIVIPSNTNVVLITINDQEYESVAKQIFSTFKFTDQKQSINLTPDQIFSEVSSQFGLNRNQLNYFRIFGQDRVQYDGVFAYKQNGKWYIAQNGVQSVADCSELNSIPEQYKPPCSESTGLLKYVDNQRKSINYPPSQMISYIGK